MLGYTWGYQQSQAKQAAKAISSLQAITFGSWSKSEEAKYCSLWRIIQNNQKARRFG